MSKILSGYNDSRNAVRQNEMTTDVLFIIRKEDTDNKYKIVDEVELY